MTTASPSSPAAPPPPTSTTPRRSRPRNPIVRYTRWLHTQWPAGTVEKLPAVREDSSTNVPGVYVVGDLTGVPLLKFAADSGARAVQTLTADAGFQRRDTSDADVLDLAIVGGGVSGYAAALEAKRHNLRFTIYEAAEPFSTIVNFPKGKPIYTYPTGMTPAGELQFHEKANVKEGLLEDLREQARAAGIEPVQARVESLQRRGKLITLHLADGSTVRAHRVIVAIGRSGNFRKLNVPGEDLGKVYNRLHDPKDYCDQDVLVVGGGDSALETAIALAECGARVTLSYRKPEFSRPKPDNLERLNALLADPGADVQIEHPSSERQTTAVGDYMAEHRKTGSIQLMMSSQVQRIEPEQVVLRDAEGREVTLKNDAVFAMIGREPPLDFFRRSGIRIQGERTFGWWASLIAFLAFCFWLYHWKGNVPLPFLGPYADVAPGWLNPQPRAWIAGLRDTLGDWAGNPANLLGTLLRSAESPSFYYTLAYSVIVVVFGIRRIRRRRTPYVKWQTLTLMAIQVVPLFILPEILLPWLAANGAFDAGVGLWVKQTFFPGETWWRAYGLILAWPLMVWNWFTAEPIWGWLILGFLQTFVLIPGMIYFWGKGSYCGWICSCGALAETLGDAHRHKMPHGPFWNRLNMLGQVILLVCFVLLGLRILGWAGVGWADAAFQWGHTQVPLLSHYWLVDIMLAGVLGYGLYFWFSGRMWCRFACPLAGLMHIYARFSRFRILADKKKCISCNVCTSVCHQGIDIMNFANKGLPMADPECVRCSACVQMCPTGVLSFGQVNPRTGETIRTDPSWLAASPVQMAELRVNGKRIDA